MALIVNIFSLSLTILICLVLYFYHLFWLKPERPRKKLRQQGIVGPPPSFFVGNIPDIKRIHSEKTKQKADQYSVSNHLAHDFIFDLYLHIEKWRADYGNGFNSISVPRDLDFDFGQSSLDDIFYDVSEWIGPVFTCTLGSMVIVCICDIDMVREFCQCKSTEFGRASYIRKYRGALFGDGLITAKGQSWAHQRKIIAPEFFNEKVKGLVESMVESATSMMDRWGATVEEAGGIASLQVYEDLKNLSAEIISKACFGSNYALGNEIFAKMLILQDLLGKQHALVGIPGVRHLPTKTNRDIWRLVKEVERSILALVGMENTASGESFLQALVKNFNDGSNGHLIVDNCKSMFLAGHETTGTTMAFALVLLAHHQEWQARARDEVLEIFGDTEVPNMDMLHKMKTLTMIIYETLRLYPPGPFMTRETAEDMKFGNYVIPKGVSVWYPLSALHYDTMNWGSNVLEFHPERFSNGISAACKLPHLFMPFGTGIRTCVGQNFAMTELKIVLSLMLSKFTFTLSPDYRHSVTYKLFFNPEFGVHLKIEKRK